VLRSVGIETKDRAGEEMDGMMCEMREGGLLPRVRQ
jgi:hypothetical protein